METQFLKANQITIELKQLFLTHTFITLFRWSYMFDLAGCDIRRHGEGIRWSPSQSRWRGTDWSWFNYNRKYKNWWRCDDCCWLPCVKWCPSPQVSMNIFLSKTLCTSNLICFILKCDGSFIVLFALS